MRQMDKVGVAVGCVLLIGIMVLAAEDIALPCFNSLVYHNDTTIVHSCGVTTIPRSDKFLYDITNDVNVTLNRVRENITNVVFVTNTLTYVTNYTVVEYWQCFDGYVDDGGIECVVTTGETGNRCGGFTMGFTEFHGTIGWSENGGARCICSEVTEKQDIPYPVTYNTVTNYLCRNPYE